VEDENTPGSPPWWLKRLHLRLVQRRAVIDRAAEYHDGVHNLAFQSKKFREAFGGLFSAFADNWCPVVVGACEQRLNVTGFRVGDNPAGDPAAWKIWQDNDLDLQAQMAHTDALALGAAYIIPWYDANDGVEITVNSPQGTIIETHPKFRRRRLAGLRCWLDEYGYEHGELFLPDTVYLFRSTQKRDSDQMMASAAEQMSWEVDPTNDDIDEADGSMANPLGIVPVVELLNNPKLSIAKTAGFGVHSDLAPIIPLQDAANKLMADMLLASEFSAFPQRYATGYDDEKGDAAAKFRSGPGNFWWLEDVDGKFGQFQAADLQNFVHAIEMVVQHIASISATPPHYLRASADRLSGESLKSAETGLVAKVSRKQSAFSEGWEESMRIAGQIAGEPDLAAATSMETIWKDAESRTEAEHVDATLKKKALGVPNQQLWEDLGYTPQQIARFKAMQAEDALLGIFAPPAAAVEPTIKAPVVRA